MVILNKGSIYAPHPPADRGLFPGLAIGDHNQNNQDSSLPVALREDFAKVCFETLLQYSLLDSEGESLSAASLPAGEQAKGLTNKLAVTSLLHRFKEVVTTFISDEELHCPIPLPARRAQEMSFVLKAIATLISSLKRGTGQVDKRTWDQVIELYPHLVSATRTRAEQVAESLQQALNQYQDLLQPPPLANNPTNNGNNE